MATGPIQKNTGPTVKKATTQPIALPPEPPPLPAPKKGTDRLAISAQAQAPASGGAWYEAYDAAIGAPVANAREFWAEKAKEGGAVGAAGVVLGGLLDISGTTSVARNTGKALDQRLSTKERLKAGGFAAGEVALNFIPIGKLGGLGGKVFKLSGGAKVVQKVRNATLLGAEVKAGTKILHHTTLEAAEKIAKSGVLRGSEQGFLSLAGKETQIALTKKGLQKTAANNGQIYAVAADGASSKLGSVVDAIVGVGADTQLGKALGKVSAPKTSYGAVVEHVLTAEEAKLARRWGKTIVTNVPPHLQGLAVSASEVTIKEGAKAAAHAPKGKLAAAAEQALHKTIAKSAQHADLAGYAYGKVMIRSADQP